MPAMVLFSGGFLHPYTAILPLRNRLEQSLPLIVEPDYSYFLRFDISIQYNNLNPQYNEKNYTVQQEELYQQIRSLKNEGLSYRGISKSLNDKGILTPNKKEWGVSGNSVHSVLKRYKEREERLELRNKKYKPVRSKMWLEYSKLQS